MLVILVSRDSNKLIYNNELKMFHMKLNSSSAEKFPEFICEKLFNLIVTGNDLPYYYIIKKFINADMLNRIDIARLKNKILKEEKLTAEMESLLNKVL